MVQSGSIESQSKVYLGSQISKAVIAPQGNLFHNQVDCQKVFQVAHEIQLDDLGRNGKEINVLDRKSVV